MPQVLGIDCGGSATRAVLVDQGKTLWTGAGGPANVSSVAEDLCRDSVRSATDGCPSPEAVCGAFAGLVTGEQRSHAESFLRDLFPKASVTAVPDFEAALVACGSGTDVCVLAGTGSVVCSGGPQGELHSSGGKGYLLGDEGSAFQYGRDALLHFLDGPPDDVSEDLRKALLDSFGAIKKAEAIAGLYAAKDPARLVASLLEAFAKDADRGAVYALKSLRIHCGKLAHVVSSHLRQYHPELNVARIACQGGLWTHQVFRDGISEQIKFWCRLERFDLNFDPPAPVYGAAEIAQRLL